MKGLKSMKSTTDLFWDDRAVSETDPRLVNLADLAQRKLENEFLFSGLEPHHRLLEVGCGNGFLTNELAKKVSHVDAFDFSENMVAQALTHNGGGKRRFFQDNVLSPQKLDDEYDVVVCIRVLINLKDLAEQRRAMQNLLQRVRPGGRLVIIEGFSEGFEQLSRLREKSDLPPLQPASINFYSQLSDFFADLNPRVELLRSFNTGSFDFLTRLVYPLLVGAENAKEYGDFHERIVGLASQFNPDCFAYLARVHGFDFKVGSK